MPPHKVDLQYTFAVESCCFYYLAKNRLVAGWKHHCDVRYSANTRTVKMTPGIPYQATFTRCKCDKLSNSTSKSHSPLYLNRLKSTR